MKRRSMMFGLAVGLVAPPGAEAGGLCRWFGRCVYESPGFRIKVVDKQTGQPLPNVHALAEWVLYGSHGTNGPLIVQDAVSGADGMLVFPPWGPLRGYRSGLVLNSDPIVTLFKPDRRYVRIYNAPFPPGTRETDRIHRFWKDGRTFEMEPVLGDITEWAGELQKAARVQSSTLSDDNLLQFRDAYLTRYRLVWSEVEKLPEPERLTIIRTTHLVHRLKFLEKPRP